MKSKILCIVWFVISVHYCDAQQAFTDEQLKKEFPKREIKYKLPKQTFALNDTSIVSTNVAYVNASEESVRENYQIIKTIKSYVYMRFFNDWRVFVSFAYLSYPSEKEFNDTTYGKYGRYIIKKGEIKIYTGAGCAKCNNTGYKGRIVVGETLVVSDEIRRLMSKGGTNMEIKDMARKEGMSVIFESGIRLVGEGFTSFEEVARVSVDQ